MVIHLQIKGYTIALTAILITCLGISSLGCTQIGQAISYSQATSSSDSLPLIDWDIKFGLGHYNTAHKVIETLDGGLAVLGMYGSQNPLNTTLVKLDLNGNVQWHQSFDLQLINYPMNTALVQTDDSGYVIAGNRYQTLNLTLIKTDLTGTIQWTQTYSNDVIAWGMTKTSEGEYLITGSTSYVATGTHPQAVLIKIDAAGEVQWRKTFGSAYNYVVVEANDGNYIVAGGNRIIKFDTSGNIKWNKELPPALPNDPSEYLYSFNNILAVIKTSDGGYALAGHTSNMKQSNEATSAAIFIKTDTNGNIQWNKTFGVEYQTWMFSVVQTEDKGYALTGMRHTVANSSLLNDFSQTDMVLTRTDESGNELWTQTFGDSQSTDKAFYGIVTSDGDFVLAGMTNPETTDSESYYYIVKTVFASQTTPTADSQNWLPVLPLEIVVVIVAFLAAIIFAVILLIFKITKTPVS